METKSIIYKNFSNKKKLLNKKRLTNLVNFKILFQKYPLLKSLTNNYNYTYNITIDDIDQVVYFDEPVHRSSTFEIFITDPNTNNFGNNVKTEIIAKSIAIPVNTPK